MILDTVPLANLFGLIALMLYILTLAPSIIRIVFPKTKQQKNLQWLFKNRRLIGISSFVFTFFHAYVLIKKRDLDFQDLKTGWVYLQGISTFIIFALLTVTSNDWSMKYLKKNWKKLHQLTYIAMFILLWHIWDKMSGHWSYVTPLSLTAMTTIIILFGIRRWREYQIQQQKEKQIKSKLPEKVTL